MKKRIIFETSRKCANGVLFILCLWTNQSDKWF